MKIKVIRTEYTDTYTKGVMLVDGHYFGYTLEDRVRSGPKVYGETAISAGIYQIVVTLSPRFKRFMPLLLNVPQFEGIRVHAGNTSKNTEGCILVAGSSKVGDWIFGSLEKKLTKLIQDAEKRKEKCTIEIVDTKDR